MVLFIFPLLETHKASYTDLNAEQDSCRTDCGAFMSLIVDRFAGLRKKPGCILVVDKHWSFAGKVSNLAGC
jgi:hypothetical protein